MLHEVGLHRFFTDRQCDRIGHKLGEETAVVDLADQRGGQCALTGQ